MKKKKMFMIIICVVMLALFKIDIKAEVESSELEENVQKSGFCGDELTWQLDEDGILNVYGEGTMFDYYMYDQVSPWYEYNSDIKEIKIGEGVESIGSYAFYGSAAEQIIISSTVRKISDTSLQNCKKAKQIYVNQDNRYFSSLDGVLLDKELTHIIYYPELKDTSKYVMPETVTVIEANAFNENENLLEVVTSKELKTIKQGAFAYCKNLKNFQFNDKIETIEAWAFEYCNLGEIYIPASLRHFGGSSVFENCSSLKKVYVDDLENYLKIDMLNIAGIDKSIDFYIQGKLATEIKIPDTITTIPWGAFQNFSRITKVEIPDGVKEIKDNAFYGCSRLENINFPQSLVEIGAVAFYDCISLHEIDLPGQIDVIGYGAFGGCTGINKVLFSNGITEVSPDMFVGCANLIYVQLPNSVNKIGDSAFAGCESLGEILIPDSVTEIGGGAFRYCYNLREVNIPNNIDSVENETFCYCMNLDNIDLPEKIQKIGDSAFEWCNSLKSITIPKNVMYIGKEAFYKCDNLSSINIKCEPPTEVSNAIYDISADVYVDCDLKLWTEKEKMLWKDDVSSWHTLHVFELESEAKASCEQSGELLFECQRCKQTKVEEIPALGHTWNGGEVTTAPTCTEMGVKTFTCETCGETRTEEVKATGHTVVDDDAVAPTCTKTGLTAGSHCSVCNEILKAQEEIAALGHTWNNGEVTTAPTCTEVGVKTFTCETCGETRTEEIKATGHTVVDDEAVAPTCTKPGLTAGSHCSVCNEVLQAQEEIPALGHTWNAGEVTTAPTYTTVGVKTFTCKICGETRTESIPKLSRIDISKATSKVKVSGISAKIYNGKSQTQSALVVTVNGKKLKKDMDYSVVYSNNKNIGTATITITGKNGYTGTVRKTFAIKTQVGKVYTTSLKYKVTNARVDGKGTVSVVGSAYKIGDRKFTTLKIADTVTIGGVKFKITRIEKNAFRGYKYLTTVTIGSNVTSVGDTAFYGCGKLTMVTVGKRVKTIGAKSFAGCKSLKRVKLLTTQLTKAGTSAFNGIKSNATFALPKKYYNSYSKMIKKAGAPKKAEYKKF
jgi:hypothetical protein